MRFTNKQSSRILLLILILLGVENVYALSPPDDPISILQCQGIVGLDFSSAGTNEQIALFIVNNNSTKGFDLSFKFANRGKFKCGALQEIPMTALVLDKVSGTLGAGLTEPVDLDVLHNLSGDEYIWNPGTGQTTTTVNYIVELRANWNNPSGGLAGFYSEVITAILTIGL